MKRFRTKAVLSAIVLFVCLLLPMPSFAYVPGYIAISSTATHSPYNFQANEFTVPIDPDPNLIYEFTTTI
ncbi:MAG: hypothetical protein J7639_17910, partial [Paenibacillaceae bacterium]|nr:hypothetical protein [Paenibacillaceae bacterium]